jgi:hypothetical protein
MKDRKQSKCPSCCPDAKTTFIAKYKRKGTYGSWKQEEAGTKVVLDDWGSFWECTNCCHAKLPNKKRSTASKDSYLGLTKSQLRAVYRYNDIYSHYSLYWFGIGGKVFLTAYGVGTIKDIVIGKRGKVVTR